MTGPGCMTFHRTKVGDEKEVQGSRKRFEMKQPAWEEMLVCSGNECFSSL